MSISAKVILDSWSETKSRLITVEATYPRFIHSEFMTHRCFSRNAASSRAIPVKKKIEAVRKDMAVPVEWGKNQKGMQAEEILSEEREAWAKECWRAAGNFCLEIAEILDGYGVHKQIANRVFEPWSHITTVITGTEWSNFFFLRTHKDAQPEFQALAKCIQKAIEESKPEYVDSCNWHTPYILKGEYETLDVETRKKVSAARCARLSYLTQDGKHDVEADLKLFDRLVSRENPVVDPGHWSPLEHVAKPMANFYYISPQNFAGCDVCYAATARKPIGVLKLRKQLCDKCGLGHRTSGNFEGWTQFRKEFEYECH